MRFAYYEPPSRCMPYERNRNMNRKKGFTLAELLIVVTIIGVLVAVSVPIFTAQRSKAVDVVNKANIRAANPWHWLHFMMTKLDMSQTYTALKWLTSNIQTAVWYRLPAIPMTSITMPKPFVPRPHGTNSATASMCTFP